MSPETNTNNSPPSPAQLGYEQFMAGQPGSPEADRANETTPVTPVGKENLVDRATRTIYAAGQTALDAGGIIRRGLAGRRTAKNYDHFISTQPGSPEADALSADISRIIDRNEHFNEVVGRVAERFGNTALKAAGVKKIVGRGNLGGPAEYDTFLSPLGGGIIARAPTEIEPLIGTSKLAQSRINKITGPARTDITKVGHFSAKFDKYDKRWYQGNHWYQPSGKEGIGKRGKIAVLRRPWKVAKDERRSAIEANNDLSEQDRLYVPTRRVTAWKATKEAADTFPAHLSAKWTPTTYLRHNKRNGRLEILRNDLVEYTNRDRDGEALWKARRVHLSAEAMEKEAPYIHNHFVNETRQELIRAVEEELKESRLHKLGTKLGLFEPHDQIVQRETEHQLDLAELAASVERPQEEKDALAEKIAQAKIETKDLAKRDMTIDEAKGLTERHMALWKREQASALQNKAESEQRAMLARVLGKLEEYIDLQGESSPEKDEEAEEQTTESAKPADKAKATRRSGRAGTKVQDAKTAREEALAWEEHESGGGNRLVE